MCISVSALIIHIIHELVPQIRTIDNITHLDIKQHIEFMFSSLYDP